MNLRYISIELLKGRYNNSYRYEFKLHTRYISNYLSKQIRNHKFVTDGTFHMISVALVPDTPKECEIVPDRVLSVDVLFDNKKYEKIMGTNDCNYYLELLEEGFKGASKFKEVPIQTLLKLVEQFRKNGCKNEWQHKKKRFKDLDIEVILNCYFTTSNFTLVASIKKISTKKKLCSGTVLKTDPDEVCFEKEFKDILIDKGKIIITDAFDAPRILIDIEDALNENFVYNILE